MCQKKTSCNVSNKLVELREDRELLARFLVVHQARPSMIQSLSDTIGKYAFYINPRSLLSSDGLLLIPTKSAFVHAIEEFIIEPSCESVGNTVIIDASDGRQDRYNVFIIDTTAVVQAIKKGSSMVICSDFA